MGNYEVILPVMDETTSLKKTVDDVLKNCGEDISRILIIVSPRTTQDSLVCIEELVKNYSGRIESILQQSPGLGGAIQDGFDYSISEFIIMMASDLETDPIYLPEMIRLSKNTPSSIVTGNRWLNRSSGFKNYGFFKIILNFIFQKFLQVLYKTKLSDLTYGYRIYPASSIKNLNWSCTDHSFLLESLILPIKRGVKVSEHPVKWKARIEGESHIKISGFVNYLKIAIKLRIFS
jgi:glycosyltransferase involved in cell wall biosynthesis